MVNDGGSHSNSNPNADSDSDSDVDGQALIHAMKHKQQRDAVRQELIQAKTISEADILQWGFDHPEDFKKEPNIKENDVSTGKRSSRYMDALMKKADERKRARQELDESRMQRQVEREREEFKDKAVFVTPSYLSKMESGGRVSTSMKYAEIVKPSSGSIKGNNGLQLDHGADTRGLPLVKLKDQYLSSPNTQLVAKPEDHNLSAKQPTIVATEITRNVALSRETSHPVLADHANSPLTKEKLQDPGLIKLEEIECARRRYFERLQNLPKTLVDLF